MKSNLSSVIYQPGDPRVHVSKEGVLFAHWVIMSLQQVKAVEGSMWAQEKALRTAGGAWTCRESPSGAPHSLSCLPFTNFVYQKVMIIFPHTVLMLQSLEREHIDAFLSLHF